MDRKLFLNNKTMGLVEKAEIVLMKYISLIKHLFFPFSHGESNISLQNHKLYYNSPYGIAGYQAVMCEHVPWLSNLDIKKNSLILDIGANVGYVALGCTKMFPKNQILCFEPGSAAFDSLKKNTKHHKRIQRYKLAIGVEKGKMNLFGKKSETAMASLVAKNETELVETVEVVSLDQFLKDNKLNKSIALLKIDVEGFELEVLKGAKKALKKTSYIHMEGNPKNYAISEIFKEISKSGRKFQIKYLRNFSNNPDDELLGFDMLLELE